MGRHWLLLPGLFPHSVVSFYWQNDRRAPGRSWRIRDYSSGTKVEHHPSHLDYTHDELLSMAVWEKKAERFHVDHPYWGDETRRLNAEFAQRLDSEQPPPSPRPPASSTASADIPVIDVQALRLLRSGTGLRRMLTSPRSEDWVSWTVFRVLERQPNWWARLLTVAGLTGIDETPAATVALWRRVASPAAYERASRARMAASDDPRLQDRARVASAVEGDTEVDIVLEHETVLWFIEAKLHSDLSANTTFDPTRNQLVRNIDVLLEQAAGRRAVMSLLTLDRRPDRFYVQLVNSYRDNPGGLHALLPHRTRDEIDAVVRDLRVLLWSDLLPLLGVFEPREVREELWRRCGFAGKA